MKTRRHLIFILAALAILVGAFLVFIGSGSQSQIIDVAKDSQAQANTPTNGLSVSPAIFELAIEPNQAVEESFYVRNVSLAPVPVSITADVLTPNEPEIDAGQKAAFDASTWLEVSEPFHIIGAGAQRLIKVKVQVPENAEPGGHYATLFLNVQAPDSALNQTGTRQAVRMGVLFFITVKGQAHHRLDFVDTPDIPYFQIASNQIPVNVTFRNNGNVHQTPTAELIVKDIFGDVKAELPLSPKIVLPNTIKTVRTTWDYPDLFGVYSAQAQTTYGPDQTQLESNKRYFVVVNWPSGVLVLLALPLLLLGFKMFKRWPAAIKAFRRSRRLR